MVHLASDTTSSRISNIDDACIQQNAVDLRLKSVHRILPTLFVIDETQKIPRETEEVCVGEDGYWLLEPGHYDVLTDHVISIGKDECGLTIVRSSLSRSAISLVSGAFDSGFNGPVGMRLHVDVGPMKIKPGTRIGQMLIWKAEALKQYRGDYGFDVDGKLKPLEAMRHKQ